MMAAPDARALALRGGLDVIRQEVVDSMGQIEVPRSMRRYTAVDLGISIAFGKFPPPVRAKLSS
jgi:hypothetical protein